MNLCLNAIQASHPPAKVILRTTVDELDKTLAADLQLTPGRYVLFQVIDEGVGIDPAIRKRIFEPFFTTKEMGRGMGLAVTHGIIQSHRGQIRTASEVEKGTTVSVWLPAAIPTRDSEQESKTTVKPKRPPRGSETVLVIDDESAVTNTIEQILSSLGYCVVSYTDADRAIAFLDTNAEDVDLMLCDLNMPKHNGREMAQRVARQFSHIAVLLISGVDESELRAQIPPEQKVDFLAKPFTMMTLAETVRETLDKQAPSSPSTPQ